MNVKPHHIGIGLLFLGAKCYDQNCLGGVEMKAGDVFYSKDPGLGERYKCHVLAIVDERMVVYKWYGKRKQWWHYQVKSKNSIQMSIERMEKAG